MHPLKTKPKVSFKVPVKKYLINLLNRIFNIIKNDDSRLYLIHLTINIIQSGENQTKWSEFSFGQ